MAIKIGRVVIGISSKGPGRGKLGQVLVKSGTKSTGKQGGKDVRKKA